MGGNNIMTKEELVKRQKELDKEIRDLEKSINSLRVESHDISEKLHRLEITDEIQHLLNSKEKRWFISQYYKELCYGTLRKEDITNDYYVYGLYVDFDDSNEHEIKFNGFGLEETYMESINIVDKSNIVVQEFKNYIKSINNTINN